MFKNLSYSVIANGVNVIVSVITVLFIPKILGIEEYAYWQLYSLYISYVGFFHFGWADGVYLKFGGKKYEQLDRQYFSTQFWLLVLLEVLIGCLIGASVLILLPGKEKGFILIMTAVCCVLQIPRTFLQYILQITNRAKDYAKNYIIEKLIYIVLVLLAVFLGLRNYQMLLLADLIAKLWMLALLMYICRRIVFVKIRTMSQGVIDAFDNIHIGSRLMFANVANLLMTGILRFSIENKWDIEVFGRVSLTLAVSNILMTFVGTVGVVIYPILKNVSRKELADSYGELKALLLVPLFALFLFYYPFKEILSGWLPQYADSLNYMALLLPICIFEGKNSMITNTYLQILRQEKKIMYINWFSVILTCLITGSIVFIWESLTLAIISLTLLFAVRSILGEIVVGFMLKKAIGKEIIIEFLLCCIFMILNWNLSSWWSIFIYLCVYILYIIYEKNKLLRIYCKLRNKFRGENK